MSRRLVVELATLAAIALAGLFVWSSVAAPYGIASETMLPTLMRGDTVLVDKRRFSPASRLFHAGGNSAERGDVVVYRAGSNSSAEAARVIGLPGDRVAREGGMIILNGKLVPRWRIADFVATASPKSSCSPNSRTSSGKEATSDGARPCRSQRYREMLPDGRTYQILNDPGEAAGDLPAATVPPDSIFVLGDDRGRSFNTRAPGRAIPLTDVIGRARIILFSSDGSWRWTAPSTWRKAIRRDRLSKPI